MSVKDPRYPLTWPQGWKRAETRNASRFGTKDGGATKALTLATGLRRLTLELARLGAEDVIISTDVPVRRDGMPYASAAQPEDPGCAVYFTLRRRPHCLACDAYTKLADNMAAIAGHIDALRAIGRYGVGTIEQAFAGYTALPARMSDETDWRAVLRIGPSATRIEAEAQYKARMRTRHRDAQDGSEAAMLQLNQAIAKAREVLS